MKTNWPDPPGWDPTPCCGSHALAPVTYAAARLYLLARAAVMLGLANGCCWMQRDYPPLGPR